MATKKQPIVNWEVSTIIFHCHECGAPKVVKGGHDVMEEQFLYGSVDVEFSCHKCEAKNKAHINLEDYSAEVL